MILRGIVASAEMGGPSIPNVSSVAILPVMYTGIVTRSKTITKGFYRIVLNVKTSKIAAQYSTRIVPSRVSIMLRRRGSVCNLHVRVCWERSVMRLALVDQADP
jgi:hypothetical protein